MKTVTLNKYDIIRIIVDAYACGYVNAKTSKRQKPSKGPYKIVKKRLLREFWYWKRPK